MVRKLCHWIRNSSKKTRVVTIFLCFVVLSELIFVGNEMRQNQEYYLTSCETEITKQIQYLGELLTKELQQGQDNSALKWLEQNNITNGNRWQFLIKNGEVKYIKNEGYTNKLLEKGLLTNKTLKELGAQNQIILSTEIHQNDEIYVYGLIVDKEALLIQGSVTKHTMYILIAVIVMSALFICTVMLSIQYSSNLAEKNKNQSDLLIQLQLKIDSVVEELEAARNKENMDKVQKYIIDNSIDSMQGHMREECKQDIIEGYITKESIESYGTSKFIEETEENNKVLKEDIDLSEVKGNQEEELLSKIDQSELLEQLLKKSDQIELMPMHIIYIAIDWGDKKCPNVQLKRMIQRLQDSLAKRHILITPNESEIVILMYSTDIQKAVMDKEKIRKLWIAPLEKQGIHISIDLKGVEVQGKAVEAYQYLRAKVLQEESA